MEKNKYICLVLAVTIPIIMIVSLFYKNGIRVFAESAGETKSFEITQEGAVITFQVVLPPEKRFCIAKEDRTDRYLYNFVYVGSDGQVTGVNAFFPQYADGISIVNCKIKYLNNGTWTERDMSWSDCCRSYLIDKTAVFSIKSDAFTFYDILDAENYLKTGVISGQYDMPSGWVMVDGVPTPPANNQSYPSKDNVNIPTPLRLSVTREKYQDVMSKSEYITDYKLNLKLKHITVNDLIGGYGDNKLGDTVMRAVWRPATDDAIAGDITAFSLRMCADVEYAYKEEDAVITRKTNFIGYFDEVTTMSGALTVSLTDIRKAVTALYPGAELTNIYYYYVGYVPSKNIYARGNAVKVKIQDTPWDAEQRPPVGYEEQDPDGNFVDGVYTDKITDGKTGEQGVITTPTPGWELDAKSVLDMAKNFINGISSLISSVGQLPAMLGALLSFLPPIVWTIVGIGLTAVIMLRIFGR